MINAMSLSNYLNIWKIKNQEKVKSSISMNKNMKKVANFFATCLID